MVKTILSVGFFLCVGLTYGQQTGKTLKTRDGSKYPVPVLTAEMTKYAVEHGSYILTEVKKDGNVIQYDGEISAEKAKKVNPADMGIAITDRDQYYKITGTNQYLVVKSTWALDGEMKMQKR